MKRWQKGRLFLHRTSLCTNFDISNYYVVFESVSNIWFIIINYIEKLCSEFVA